MRTPKLGYRLPESGNLKGERVTGGERGRIPNGCDTLLITSAVAPPSGIYKLALSDVRLRLFQTFCACVCWSREPAVRRVVLCDGTNGGNLLMPLRGLFAESGKEFELLHFNQPFNAVREYGKGFGEGVVIEHALNHSEVLSTASSFFKVTGRLYIRNFSTEMQATHCGLPTFAIDISDLHFELLRLIYRGMAWFDSLAAKVRHSRSLNPGVTTVFWHSPTQFYKEKLIHAYLDVRDRDGYFLEHAMFSALARSGACRFHEQPAVVGQSGSNPRFYPGGDYADDIKKIAESM